MTFAELVKTLRKRLGISQNALAELAGVSPRTIFGYEAGTTYPRTDIIRERLAKALGVDKQELIGDEEQILFSIRKGIEFSPAEQAEVVTEQMIGLLMSGMLTDDEKDAMLQAVQKAYWDSKRRH